MPYILFIVGLLTMCVPEDASLMRFIIQGGIGLLIFMLGIGMLIESSEK